MVVQRKITSRFMQKSVLEERKSDDNRTELHCRTEYCFVEYVGE